MHAADLMQEAYESPSSAPQKEPKPVKPWLSGGLGENVNIDTNGRGLDPNYVEKVKNHYEDSVWGYHN